LRLLGTLFTAAIVAFWLVMNTVLIRRELEIRSLDRYQRGLADFLGPLQRRERWMGIYQGHRKIGYSGFVVERDDPLEGREYRMTIETLCQGELPEQGLLGGLLRGLGGNRLEISGDLRLDRELKPLDLRLDLRLLLLQGTSASRAEHFFLSGRRQESSFIVTVRHGEEQLLELGFPVDRLVLSDGLAPCLPLAGYKAGESYRTNVFDPLGALGFGSSPATVRVLSQEPKEVGGMRLDVFELETELRGSKSRSWVTANGELIRHEMGPPLGIVLKLEESREQATREFKRR
jgi:hypothetical protein